MLSSGFDYNQTKLRGAVVETKKRFEKPFRIGSYKAGGKITINLPQIPNSFADLKNAYLKFDITTADLAKFDNTAYCLFDRIVVSSKAVVLDELQGVPSYYNLATSLENIPLAGYNSPIGQGNDDRLPHVGLEVSTSTASPTKICIPFVHGIFGADKYLPLFSEAGVKLEFYLNDVNKALLSPSSGHAVFTITNVEFVYPMLTLPLETFKKLESDVENYYIDVNSCYHHQIGVPSGSVRENHIIPARYSSINSILLMMRNTSDSTTVNKVKYSTRSANRLESIQFRHKGQNYPEQPLTRTAGSDGVANQRAKQSSEMFLESLSTYASINSYEFKQKGDMFVLRYSSLEDDDAQNDGDGRNVINTYERENGSLTSTLANATSISSNDENTEFGSFFVAVPLSSYKSPELNKAMYSGLNTIGADVFVTTEFGTGGVVAESLFDYYTHYSSVIILDKNTLEFSIMN